ncbi:hypothetical protein DEI81_07905 [Curtobacterium sp. MCBD17_013]|uniref:transglutaminase family protein n=1 Tax=Curtobacterium sp. MCBD17_013 TaxID=2175668 RepID=UPI000DA71091|nr:DUF3488 and transglutaminase-like domain-containing protein [Curtobacterium sp. MCBD17_013]PZF63322.1 hypothetical protein DEI81_07905 [Curtobacterium sp. MCBD17_013]
MTDTARRPVTGRDVLERDDRTDEDPGTPSRTLVAAAALPVVVASLAVRPLVQGIAWWVSALVVTALLVGVMLAVRTRPRWARFVALVVTLVGGSCALAILDGTEPLGWLDRSGALGQALLAIKVNPAPLPETDAVQLVVSVTLVWTAGVALFVAVIAPTAALAAVPAFVALVVPGTVTGTAPSVVLVVLTGMAFLLVLWLSVRPVQQAFPAMVIGAVALVVAVGLPTVVPIDASWLSGVTGAIQAPINPGRPGTLLKLGDDLRRPSEIEVFRYRTTTGVPEYLKLADLDEFGTGDWVPSVVDASTAPSADQGQFATGVNPRVASREDVQVRVTGLSSQYLPLPSGAVGIQSRSTALDLTQWRWMGRSNTVRSTGQTTRRGDVYQAYGVATFANPYLDAIAQHGRFGMIASGDWNRPTSAQLHTDLQLPRNLPGSIRAAAERVAGTAGDQYEQARALESWFRSGRFTYSETAPVEQGYDGDSMDVVAKFLQVRAGYCVHFASAMAVMARVLGIPSRIAVGYRPGGTQKDGEYVVSNRQLHSWPELYIKGAGWVGFEPTPVAQDQSDAELPATASPTSLPTVTPLRSAPANQPTAQPSSASPTPDAASGAGTGGPDGGSATWEIALAVLVALGALVGPGLFRTLRRRRRLGLVQTGRDPAANAWREVIDDVADHGFTPATVPPDDPALAARTARAVLTRLGATLPPVTLTPLGTVVDALDRERYARPGTAPVDQDRLRDAVREVRVGLDAAVSPWRRVLSRVWPPSLAPSRAWTGRGRRHAAPQAPRPAE